MRPVPAIVPALALAFITTVSLVLPWLAIGSAPARSSIDLIGSLNALDVVDGISRALIVGAWLLIPVAIAAALLLGASGRTRMASGVVLAVSVLVVFAALAVVLSEPIGIGWGGVLGAVTACGAAAFALKEITR